MIRSIKEVHDLRGKRVLLRVDFNVPLKGKKIVDDFKIQKSLPTIKYLITRGAQVLIVGHLGRPNGMDAKLSLRPVATHLAKILKKKVAFVTFGTLAKLFKIGGPTKFDDGVVFLENIRFFAEEERNNAHFAKQLARLADMFVLDGFAVAHRAAASVSGVAKFLPSYAGLLLSEEIKVLSEVMDKPKRPLTVILAGAKVETKIPVLKNLLAKADHILVGGGIANTYWWAKGKKVGQSLVGKENKREVLKYCSNKKVVLPVDVVVGDEKGKKAWVMPIDSAFKISNIKLSCCDIGPETVRLFSKYIKNAETLIWNGAMGWFEQHPYEYGTYALASLFAARSKSKAYGVAGGGETVEILQKLYVLDDIDFVSTGGGAMLEFLSGKKLPGIEALDKKSFIKKLFLF